MTHLIFLKLGGSLITDKYSPHTANLEVIHFLAEEIRAGIESDPGLQILLGHGSGSFGHIPASRYHTRQGVHTVEEWRGFAEVWSEASALNRLVVDQMTNAGLPVVAFPPSAGLISVSGQVDQWNIAPILSALEHDLLPVIYGDVVFDRILGGTIFSTEQLFSFLASELHPDRILIAGVEPGVWADYPACTKLIAEITPAAYPELSEKLFPSNAVDVTGGMASKVQDMVKLVSEVPHIQVTIFNPSEPGSLGKAIRGDGVGTTIHS